MITRRRGLLAGHDVPAHQIRHPLVHRDHPLATGGLHRALELVRLAVADQAAHGGRAGHHLEGGDPALAVGAAEQALRDHGQELRPELHADLRLLVRGEDYYQPISWEAALEKIAAKLRGTTANETFWYASGRSSNEAGFLLQLFARLYGTNNVNNCSYYCHQASGVGLNSVLGSGVSTVQLEDIEEADLFVLIGGNPDWARDSDFCPQSSFHWCEQIRRKEFPTQPLAHDGRIKAAVIADPLAVFFTVDSFVAVTVPVQLWASEHGGDGVSP